MHMDFVFFNIDVYDFSLITVVLDPGNYAIDALDFCFILVRLGNYAVLYNV